MGEELFNELHKDHETVKELLEKLSAGSTPGKSRGNIFEKLKQEITPHMKGEEKALYSLLLEERTTKEDAMQAMEEHHVAEVVLRELDRLSLSDEKWKAKIAVLKDVVEHHIEEEEEKIFQDARQVFDDEEMNEIFENFQKNKQSTLSRLKRARAA